MCQCKNINSRKIIENLGCSFLTGEKFTYCYYGNSENKI